MTFLKKAWKISYLLKPFKLSDIPKIGIGSSLKQTVMSKNYDPQLKSNEKKNSEINPVQKFSQWKSCVICVDCLLLQLGIS